MILGVGVGTDFRRSRKKQIYDSFDRLDGAIGTADSGQVWTEVAGPWVVSSNLAACTSVATTRYATIDSGAADCRISCKLSAIPNGNEASNSFTRIMFRFLDGSNELHLQASRFNAPPAYTLQKRVANVLTTLGTYSVTPIDGDLVEVILNGPVIRVFLNGSEIMSVSETFNQTVTVHGIGVNNSLTPRFDNFKVVPL